MFRVFAQWFRQDAAECPYAGARRRAVAAPATPDPAEPGPACGWFDSSWELRRGLKVVEYSESDPLPAGVPLEWLLRSAA